MTTEIREQTQDKTRRLLLREPEACEMLGISRHTLRGLMAGGAIVAVHIGRSVRFPLADIESLVEKLRTEAREQGGEGRG